MKDLPLVCFVFIFLFLTLMFISESKFRIDKTQEEEKFEEIKKENNSIIKQINEKRKKITNIFVKSIIVENKFNRINISSNGTLAYKKNDFFRLILNSVFGKEVDIGSNDKLFWYWSKRSVDKALCYSAYEDIKKTRLKEPLNPILLKINLLIDEIPETQECKIYESSNNILITWQYDSINDNSKLTCVLKIEKHTLKPKEITLYDSKNNLLTKSTIQNLFKYNEIYLPQKINMLWPSENIQTTWNLKDITFNHDINEKLWQMPEAKNKIDIGKN